MAAPAVLTAAVAVNVSAPPCATAVGAAANMATASVAAVVDCRRIIVDLSAQKKRPQNSTDEKEPQEKTDRHRRSMEASP
jgi:hypothetical protein